MFTRPMEIENFVRKDWHGKWIWNDSTNQNTFILIRKCFIINPHLKKAVINISTDSRYRLYINGEYVGKGINRCESSYWYYNSYEITDKLREGVNIIAIKARYLGRPFADYTPIEIKEDILEQDEIPYFRDSWYHKPFLICPHHHCLLLDACPHCNAPIQYWNTPWNSDITLCSECGKCILISGISMLILKDLDYYSLIEQAFNEYGKNHNNLNKSRFFQYLWKNISKYSKDPVIQQTKNNDMVISRENLLRAILVDLQFIIQKPNRRKSVLINRNGKVEHKYTIEDLEIKDGDIPKEYEEIVMQRINSITPLLKIEKRTYEDVKNQAEFTGFSSKTLINWMKRYREDGITGLIPQHNKCGRKKRQYLPEINELLEKCITDYISKAEEVPFVDCWNYFNQEASNRGYSSYQLPKMVTFYSRYSRKLNQIDKGSQIPQSYQRAR